MGVVITAVVLAAGKGTRMGSSEGSEIPKVMFEVHGKPLIRYSVDNLEQAGLDKIVLVVGYKKELIEEYFGDEVEYAVQEQQLGTGHAVISAKDKIRNSEAVLICCGDMPLFSPETIKALLTTYDKEIPVIALLSVKSDNQTFNGFGRIVRSDDGYVDRIVELRDCTDDERMIDEFNVGFYIFNTEWLLEALDKIKTGNAQGEYYLTDVIGIAKEDGKKIVAINIENETEALGVNTPEQLKEVENVLSSVN